MAMLMGKLADDAVLHRIQILEFVHENRVIAASDCPRYRWNSEKLRGLEEQSVEIDDVPLGGRALIAVVVLLVPLAQRLPAKTVARKGVEHAFVKLSGNLEPPKKRQLVKLVGDSEAFLQSYLVTVLPQEIGAKRMDSSAPDALDARSELTIETRCDLAGSLVGEGEDADASGVETTIVD